MRVRLFAFALLVALVAPAVGTAADPKDKKYDSAANLYLMRKLDVVLSSWKSPSTPPGELGVWLVLTKREVARYSNYAESYHAAPEVVRAYKGVAKLIDTYEKFLRDLIFVDLISDVARPESEEWDDAMKRGALYGGLNAIESIDITDPGGSLLRALTGPACGAARGYIEWTAKQEEVLKKNQSIDSKVWRAKMGLVNQLTSDFEAAIKNVQDDAKILADKEGWGKRAGFHRTGDESLSSHLKLRSDDAFLLAAHGMSKMGDPLDYREAAADLYAAARLIPKDASEDLDLFDETRARYLLLAARLAEHAARTATSTGADAAAAAEAIKYYRAACDCLTDRSAIPADCQLAFARACGIAGEKEEAKAVFDALLKKSPGNARLLYEYAGVQARLGNTDDGLYLLKKSFAAQTRWQPSALTDPHLSALVAAHPAAVKRLAAEPLVGQWTCDGMVMEFHQDGTYRQKFNGKSKEAKYDLPGDGKFRLTLGSSEVKELDYTLNGDWLTVGDFAMKRTPIPLVGTWTFKHTSGAHEYDFRSDGTYRKVDGKGVTTRGVYAISPSAGEYSDLITSRTDTYLDRQERPVQFKVAGKQLSIKVPGDPTPFVFERK